MKHIKFFMLAIMLVAFGWQTSNAQVEVGLRGGINLSNLVWSNDDGLADAISSTGDAAQGLNETGIDDSDNLLGFHAGAYATFDLGLLSLTPELLYSTKGNKGLWKDNAGNNLTTRVHYLSVPLLLGINPIDFLHIQVGPQFGFNLNTTQAPEDGDATKVENLLTDFDYGAMVGLLFDFERANIGVRYTYGLAKAYEYTSGDDYKMQNRNLQITVGVPLYNTLFSDK